jgi:IS30 family transposase
MYEGRLDVPTVEVLRHKGKRKKPQETRGRFNVGTSITKRPKEVRKRETFGHWELDSVVSGRGKSKGCLATFLERKTRWYIAIKMPDRTAVSMEAAIHRLQKEYPKGSFQTATTDRGKEFSCYPAIEEDLKIKVTLILLGKEAVMKTQMVYFESFSQKEPISLSLQRVNFQRRLL